MAEPPPWVQVRAGHELAHLVRLLRTRRLPETTFLHSQYDAERLIWHWFLKWAAHVPKQEEHV